MPSPDTSEKALRELSRVHAAQLAAYATARLKLQRPDLSDAARPRSSGGCRRGAGGNPWSLLHEARSNKARSKLDALRSKKC